MIAMSNDIISDVVAAADPKRAEAARRKLEALAASDGQDFSRLVAAQPQAHPAVRPSTKPALAPVVNQLSAGRPAAEDATAMAFRGLGSVLLQKTFELMMPEPGGQGLKSPGGAMWKSMLAQKLADAVSPTIFQQSAIAVTEHSAKRDTPRSIS